MTPTQAAPVAVTWTPALASLPACDAGPINSAPKVDDILVSPRILRGQPAQSSAMAGDPDRDPLTSRWSNGAGPGNRSAAPASDFEAGAIDTVPLPTAAREKCPRDRAGADRSPDAGALRYAGTVVDNGLQGIGGGPIQGYCPASLAPATSDRVDPAIPVAETVARSDGWFPWLMLTDPAVGAP
jgi:hypothetical protein